MKIAHSCILRLDQQKKFKKLLVQTVKQITLDKYLELCIYALCFREFAMESVLLNNRELFK